MVRKKSISRRKFLDAAGLASMGVLASPQLTNVLEKARQSNAQTRMTTDPAQPIMSKLATFIASTRYETIPPKALETAKIAIMDCLGVAIAGGREASAQISGKLAREERARE